MKKLIAIVVLAAAPALFAQVNTITTESQAKTKMELKKAEKVENIKTQDVEMRVQDAQNQNSVKTTEAKDAKKASLQDPEKRAMLKQKREVQQKAEAQKKELKRETTQSDDARAARTK